VQCLSYITRQLENSGNPARLVTMSDLYEDADFIYLVMPCLEQVTPLL
jgi:hypothetical protein